MSSSEIYVSFYDRVTGELFFKVTKEQYSRLPLKQKKLVDNAIEMETEVTKILKSVKDENDPKLDKLMDEWVAKYTDRMDAPDAKKMILDIRSNIKEYFKHL